MQSGQPQVGLDSGTSLGAIGEIQFAGRPAHVVFAIAFEQHGTPSGGEVRGKAGPPH